MKMYAHHQKILNKKYKPKESRGFIVPPGSKDSGLLKVNEGEPITVNHGAKNEGKTIEIIMGDGNEKLNEATKINRKEIKNHEWKRKSDFIYNCSACDKASIANYIYCPNCGKKLIDEIV